MLKIKKICNKCGIEKSIMEFHKGSGKNGVRSVCKICSNKQSKINSKIHYQNNKEKEKKRTNEFRINNQHLVKKWKKDFYDKHKKQILEDVSKYRNDNRQEINSKKILYYKKIRKNEPWKILFNSIYNRTNDGVNKLGSMIETLGYDHNQLKLRLEMNFKDNMNWDNYGKFWELDHKKPLQSFNHNKSKIINSLSNLIPMEIKLNRSRNNRKINKELCLEQ